MNILIIGDIVGTRSITYLKENLWKTRDKYKIDYVIANGENASEIHGVNAKDARDILDTGVDFITLGNHTWNNDTERKGEILRTTGENQFINSNLWVDFLNHREKKFYEMLKKEELNKMKRS